MTAWPWDHWPLSHLSYQGQESCHRDSSCPGCRLCPLPAPSCNVSRERPLGCQSQPTASSQGVLITRPVTNPITCLCPAPFQPPPHHSLPQHQTYYSAHPHVITRLYTWPNRGHAGYPPSTTILGPQMQKVEWILSVEWTHLWCPSPWDLFRQTLSFIFPMPLTSCSSLGSITVFQSENSLIPGIQSTHNSLFTPSMSCQLAYSGVWGLHCTH